MSSYRSNSAPERTPYVSSSTDPRQGRTMSRADMTPYAHTNTTDEQYRRRSRERYPPDGLTRITTSSGRSYYQPYPPHMEAERDEYKEAHKMKDNYRRAYNAELKSRVSFEQSRGIDVMFKPNIRTNTLNKHSVSGVHTVESHARLHAIASAREQAAYVTAAGRTSFYRDYPYSSADVEGDEGHHKALDVTWADHEKADKRERHHRQHRTPYRRYS